MKNRRPISKKKNCVTRKRRYRDLDEAKTALKQTRTKGKQGDNRRTEQRAYRCHLCAGYHLTSNA